MGGFLDTRGSMSVSRSVHHFGLKNLNNYWMNWSGADIHGAQRMNRMTGDLMIFRLAPP